MLENNTRNQHFLPRVEQKLNAANPAADDQNLRIYSFRLVDRDVYSLELENPKGRRIGASLSLFDLFSFDVLADNELRHNFESLFQQYEANIETHTNSLLAKLNGRTGDIKAEIVDLFAAKLLNFVRNPFSIAKVINTFPHLATYAPAHPALLAEYQRIVTGRKPHQAHLCAQLGVSDQQYQEWLRILFMLLFRPGDNQPNLFEALIKGILEDRKTHIAAFVCEYDDDSCLLSDRGYSQPIPDGKHMAFSFNLCRSAFIHYFFSDPSTLLQGRASPEFLSQAIQNWESRPHSNIQVTHLRNHRAMLAQYNRRVVEQCHARVYCAIDRGPLLIVPADNPNAPADPRAS